MADIRVKDLAEASVPGADYYLLTDSATDGVKKVKTTNVVKPADIGAASLTGAETLTNKTLTSPVVNSPTGIVKGDVGLGNVDNTSDASKPVSTATQTALDLKANTADLGTAAAAATTDFATAAQGAKADSAVQPGTLGTLATKNAIAVPADITATGTPSGTTALFGDGSWKTITGGGDMLASVYAQRIYDFDTVAAATAATVPAAQNAIRTGGYGAAGDGGGALYKRVGALPSHPGYFQSADGAYWEICEPRLNVLMFGAKRDQAGVDSWQAFKNCHDTIVAQRVTTPYRYGQAIHVPAGQYELSKQFDMTAPGVRMIGEGGTTSALKAQAGFAGSYIVTHQPPSGDTTTVMTGVGVIGIGLDCNEVAVHGYLGEMVYDGIVYDDFRIDRPGAAGVGFTLRPRAGNATTVCQTIDIRSLFVGKYTVKGTAPAVLLDNCQEVNIWSSKAWNGYGVDDTNKGTAAAWFIQDCRTVTMVGCSAAGSVWAGVEIYANTRDCVGIALVNPLFENLDVNLYVDSSTPASWNNQDVSVINPRHESPAGIYTINSMVRGHIEVIDKAVSLNANTSSVEVLANALSQITDSGTNNILRSRELGATGYTPVQTGTAPGTASGNIKYFDGKMAYVSLRFSATGTGTIILKLPTGKTAASFGNQTLYGFDAGIDGSIIYGHIGASANTVVFEKSGAYGTGFAANNGNYQVNGVIMLA